MRLNGTSHGHGGGVNGRKVNGAAEPSMDDILTFLRGTLSVEPGTALATANPREVTRDTPRMADAESAEPDRNSSSTSPGPAAAEAPPPVAAGSPPAVTDGVAATPLKPASIPFKDTRFSRLGAAARPPELIAEASVVTPPPAEVSRQPSPSDGLASLGSARQTSAPPPETNTWPFGPAPQRPAAEPHWTAAAMSRAMTPAVVPPPLPPSANARIESVESASAEMLRPVLRQWLSENMPRIVEKALRIEMTSGVAPREPEKK